MAFPNSCADLNNNELGEKRRKHPAIRRAIAAKFCLKNSPISLYHLYSWLNNFACFYSWPNVVRKASLILLQ